MVKKFSDYLNIFSSLIIFHLYINILLRPARLIISYCKGSVCYLSVQFYGWKIHLYIIHWNKVKFNPSNSDHPTRTRFYPLGVYPLQLGWTFNTLWTLILNFLSDVIKVNEFASLIGSAFLIFLAKNAIKPLKNSRFLH